MAGRFRCREPEFPGVCAHVLGALLGVLRCGRRVHIVLHQGLSCALLQPRLNLLREDEGHTHLAQHCSAAPAVLVTGLGNRLRWGDMLPCFIGGWA